MNRSKEQQAIGGRQLQSRVLIVDDSLESIQRLGIVLREQNYLINVARSGVEALEVVERVRPDLILLDVTMPEMGGFETCAHLKECGDTAEIPVVFLTGKTDEEHIVKGFEVGAADYMIKPFNTSEIIARVRTHLSHYHLRKELEDRAVELAAELDRSDKLQKRIASLQREQAAFLTHELKNYINPIMGYAGLLNTDIDKLGAKHANWVGKISDAIRSMVNVIDSLKHLYDIEAGMFTLERKPANIDLLVKNVIQDLRTVFGETAVIVYEDHLSNHTLEGDFSLLTTVFRNLIKNAIEHVSALESKSARTVKIVASDTTEHVTISICNGGEPIPPHKLPTFFEKFSTDTSGGMGMGTAYADLVIKEHGGVISVTSDATEGTILTVMIQRKMS